MGIEHYGHSFKYGLRFSLRNGNVVGCCDCFKPKHDIFKEPYGGNDYTRCAINFEYGHKVVSIYLSRYVHQPDIDVGLYKTRFTKALYDYSIMILDSVNRGLTEEMINEVLMHI